MFSSKNQPLYRLKKKPAEYKRLEIEDTPKYKGLEIEDTPEFKQLEVEDTPEQTIRSRRFQQRDPAPHSSAPNALLLLSRIALIPPLH